MSDFIKAGTSAIKCPDCGCEGAHYCVGKKYPDACNINFPPFDNPPQPIPMTSGLSSVKMKMSAEDIKKFAAWLGSNKPVLEDENEYWELFAYRIVDRLGV